MKMKRNLTSNTGRMKLAFEDIKRLLDTNAEPDIKVHKVEKIIDDLYE